MEITLSDNNKLKIILSRHEVLDMGFPTEHIHRDPNARELLIALLEKGRDQTGFHPNKAKLIVEVLPHEDGGCVICFTALDNTHFPFRHRGMRPVVFEFDDVDTVIEAGSHTFERYSHRIYKSSLYVFEKKYRLVVYPLDYSDRLSVFFLSEYGHKLGEGDLLAAYTEEHGKELIKNNALDTLAYYFGDSPASIYNGED